MANKLLEDDRSKDAVLRNLEVIGEAAKSLPRKIKPGWVEQSETQLKEEKKPLG